MMHLGGVSEIDKPGQYDGLERKAIGNDEVKDRTAGDATDNLFNNNGLDSSGKTYKNTKEKIKEDGNELIAKKTNNDVKDEKYAKDNSYNRTVNNNKQSIHEGEYNINNINNNNMNEYNQANTADTATAAFGEGNNTNELAENKLTPPKKQKKKGILNKLFWGKQKSSDSSESSSNAQSNECDNNGGANEVVNEENNYECICGVCNACTNNRKEEEKERKKKKKTKKKHSEECDDNIILRTTVNTMTTTMTTTVDFHNKPSEQELIQQPRHEESSEYQEECSEHYAQRRELIQESEQNPSIEEVDATVNKSATPSTKCAHVKMTKKERTNRAKAEFALHDPLNEVGDDDPVMTSKERKAEEKLKRKEEHSHQTSCELDEFQDHMTGSVYNGSDICPHCNYPRSSSVWCPVSLRHHGSDALCTLHQSSGAASHDSTKRSPRTLFGKGKDVKKNIASSNDTNNSSVDDLHSTPIPSSESSSSPAFSSDHKVTHSITSWFNRRGPHHRHKHHGSNDDDNNNNNNNCNYNDNTQESEQCCLNSADTSNLDDASTEQVSSPEQQALLERGEANFETAHPNRLVTTKIQSNCDNTFTSSDANHTENNQCEEIIVHHDHSLLSAPLEAQKVAPEQNTMNGEPNTHNDDANKNTFSSDVQGEEMLNIGETQWNEHEMQYYYFVNENGETMYYATRVTGNENDNVHNEHEINKEKLEIQNSKLPDETINEHDISKHYKDYTYDNDQKETKENTKVNTNGKNLDEKANEHALYNKDNKVEEHVTQYSKQTNDNVNDGTLTWNASHSSLTTTDNISEKCESNSKRKQGFAKKISHFFSRSNKTSPESENLIVCCHHADPVTMEVTATTSKEINESCCHEESNNGNGGAIERETECSNKNVITVSTPETSGVDHTSNSYEDIKSGAANNNSTEDNNECKSPQPTTSQVVVTEVAYDTKVTEKKVPRLTEKELRQRFKELYKDEKKQREVLEMEYKKEHNALKRCCRADVIEIDRVRHAKKHNIKERKENSGKGKNNPEDDDNDKEEHKSTNENY